MDKTPETNQKFKEIPPTNLLDDFLDTSQDNYLPFYASSYEPPSLELYDNNQPVKPEKQSDTKVSERKSEQSDNSHKEKSEKSKQSDSKVPDGTKVIINEQGTKITLLPDETTIFEYSDKIAAQTGVKKDSLTKDGVHITESTNGQKVTSYPDTYPDKKLAGVIITQTPDNSTVTRYPDNYPDKKLASTIVTQNPDHSVATRYPDYSEKTVFPDQKVELKLPNGTKITELHDGTKIYGSANDAKYPTITVKPDKSVICQFCDGAEFKGKLSKSFFSGDITITSNTDNSRDGTYTNFKLTRKTDGTIVIETKEAGTATSLTFSPDGTKSFKDSKGFQGYDDGKGNGYVIYPDNSDIKKLDVKTQNEGTTFTMHLKNGKTEIYKPDGSVQYLDANNKLEKEERLEGTLADGSPVEVSIVNGMLTGKLQDGTIVNLKHPTPQNDDVEKELPQNQFVATDANGCEIGIVTLNERSNEHLKDLQDIYTQMFLFKPPTDLSGIDKDELPV